MKFLEYLCEYDETKVQKLVNVFSNLPSDTPENIVKYIVNIFQTIDLKQELGGSLTYLSGPMTNLPDDNWPVFTVAEKYIGGSIFNPAKPHGYIIKKAKGSFTWSDFMVEDVYNLLKCNNIVVLPGWSKSTGARVEVKIGEGVLNTTASPLRKNIGNTKYQLFINDVKDIYYKDGNNQGFDTVIGPMLTTKTETEAAKYVKPYTPAVVANEGVVDNIKDIVVSMKDYSVLNILKTIGAILDKKHSRKITR